jgi:hypothetical protein
MWNVLVREVIVMERLVASGGAGGRRNAAGG